MTRKPNGTLYIGVTKNLPCRIWEHREGMVDGFSKKYDLKYLVYAEPHNTITAAFQREKNIKHWSRAWMVKLVLEDNPNWNDVYDQLS